MMYMCRRIQTMTGHIFGANPSPLPMQNYCQLEFVRVELKLNIAFSHEGAYLKIPHEKRLRERWRPFSCQCQVSLCLPTARVAFYMTINSLSSG